MDNKALSVTPSLAKHFAPERLALQSALQKDLLPSQVVGEARRALDRTGLSFTREVDDPQIQKSGLWLLEIIKSGAGILDRATHADISVTEIAPKVRKFDALKSWRPGLFYSVAGVMAVIGFLQASGLVVMTSVVLASLHGLANIKGEVLSRLPFVKKPVGLPQPDGRVLKHEAVIKTDQSGFINQISEALSTADHILSRMSQTTPETHWRDDPAMLSLFQNLLEARTASDGKYALELVSKDMQSVLSKANIETVIYSKKTSEYFDELPALIMDGVDKPYEMAAPALITKDGRLLRRGTVWVRRS